MEDNQPTPSTTPPPAARTAQALRELHDRARTALAAQRDRMGQLEAQLTQQLDTISDTLAEQTERTQLLAADSDRSPSLDQRHQELEARQQALDDRATQLNHQDRELRQRQEALDASAAECAAQQTKLGDTEQSLERQRADVAEREAALQKSHAELDQAREELAARELAVQNEQASLSAARQLTDNESAAKQASLEQQLNTERSAWERERANVEEQRRLLAKERDDLSTALEAARGELATARENEAAAGERDELQHKFDLALEDVQRLRARVAELEQELANRPEADETDSVELVHLRAERDAMAERIAELEQKSAAEEGANAAPDQTDLQRRFELAVEDVRDLKKRNTELEAQIAAGKSPAVPATASGGSGSWEAMKKQMLANLEDEGDDVGVERQQERATIQNTIRLTDEALAHKDREIADLKSQLAEGTPAVPKRDEAVERLVDADEVIAEHRARIAKLEKEIHEKLRTAELEVSVERAKIARETAHLTELKAEIDARRASGETPGVPGAAQQPKRRWLSKLGLSGEDEVS